jgi:hypothetical protein
MITLVHLATLALCFPVSHLARNKFPRGDGLLRDLERDTECWSSAILHIRGECRAELSVEVRISLAFRLLECFRHDLGLESTAIASREKVGLVKWEFDVLSQYFVKLHEICSNIDEERQLAALAASLAHSLDIATETSVATENLKTAVEQHLVDIASSLNALNSMRADALALHIHSERLSDMAGWFTLLALLIAQRIHTAAQSNSAKSVKCCSKR